MQAVGQHDTFYDWQALDAIGGTLADVSGAAYNDPTIPDNGGEPSLLVTIGTPKPDQCWELLAYDALADYGGHGDLMNITTLTPGPHLAAAHAVLVCSGDHTPVFLCAWAGPGPVGGKPVFGAIWVMTLARAGQATLTDETAAALTDKVYGITAAR
jgi:hypothetical protein